MIVSRGRNYIFVHAPKTGGTSLALALEARAMADDVLIGDTPKAQKRQKRLKGLQTQGRLWKHSTLRDIYGLIRQEEIEHSFVFMLVRNPWDRIVSYYHWLQGQSFDHSAVTLAKLRSFSEFLHNPKTQAAFRTQPYGSYVRDATGVERCAAFVRLEHLDTDLAPVEAHLGFSLDMPHENASPRAADYRSYYADRDSKLVGNLCAEDIKRFKYQF